MCSNMSSFLTKGDSFSSAQSTWPRLPALKKGTGEEEENGGVQREGTLLGWEQKEDAVEQVLFREESPATECKRFGGGKINK